MAPLKLGLDFLAPGKASNATYEDAKGDLQGEMMFVATDCTTDERLNMTDKQDPRYSKALDPNYNSISASPVPR